MALPKKLRNTRKVKVKVTKARMFTAIYKKVQNGYISWIEEIPGVNTQGRTRKEARENLGDALKEFIAARRSLTRRESGGLLVRERLAV
jgi:predicted RNase H-like HicB family nuclease